MKALVTLVRIGLGVYLIANGLNFFFHFLEFPPVKNEIANLLMAGFVKSGMFEFVKVAEVLCGLSLIFNIFVPLSLVITFPIVVIIAYIDVFILRWELGGIINGGIFFVVYSAILLLHLPYYKGMFVLKADIMRGLRSPDASDA
jgi:putative oxidoreductase